MENNKIGLIKFELATDGGGIEINTITSRFYKKLKTDFNFSSETDEYIEKVEKSLNELAQFIADEINKEENSHLWDKKEEEVANV